MKSKPFIIIFVVILIILGVGVYWYLRGNALPAQPSSSGSRDNSWLTYSDEARKISFRYPADLGAKYISVQQWPPAVEVAIAQFLCAEPLRQINGRGYCVGSETEGAAGSVYTTYTYNTMKDGRMVSLRFTLRYSQCGNYDETERKACESERETFDLDGVVDKIAQSLTLTASTPGLSGKSGITGIALLGPICPVEPIPPDPKCADKPYKTSLVITTADQARVIKTASTDENGKFSVELPPGEYAIRSAAAADIRPYCSNRDTIVVKSGSYTDTTVYCDTGIR